MCCICVILLTNAMNSGRQFLRYGLAVEFLCVVLLKFLSVNVAVASVQEYISVFWRICYIPAPLINLPYTDVLFQHVMCIF